MYAPIIVFAYNRTEHLKKVLLSLRNNKEANDSELYVFIDGPKDNDDQLRQEQVLKTAQEISDSHFKNVHITCSKENKGLAPSVISGVGTVLEHFDRAIIVEDDSLVAASFLKFMNEALAFYYKDDLIWSVGGYTVPMRMPEDYHHDIIVTQRSSSYAWATWKNRWDRIDWDVSDYPEFCLNFNSRVKFNRWGMDKASMLDDQMNHRINSWAIRFDYAMFRNHMYNIIPAESLVANIGFDGTGTHNAATGAEGSEFSIDRRSTKEQFYLEHINVDEKIRKSFRKVYDGSYFNLFKRFISNQLIYRGIIRR